MTKNPGQELIKRTLLEGGWEVDTDILSFEEWILKKDGLRVCVMDLFLKMPEVRWGNLELMENWLESQPAWKSKQQQTEQQ